MRTSVDLVRSEKITQFQCIGILELRPSCNGFRRQLARSESPEVGVFERIGAQWNGVMSGLRGKVGNGAGNGLAAFGLKERDSVLSACV